MALFFSINWNWESASGITVESDCPCIKLDRELNFVSLLFNIFCAFLFTATNFTFHYIHIAIY